MPLTPDEAGYGEVARLWSEGAELYDDAWVDRPQGLVLVFRVVLWVSSSPEAMRALAILLALGVLLLTACIADRLVGRRVAVYAVLFMGTAGASPFIESFTLSGELLASLFAVATMLVFVLYLDRRSLWLVALAGVLTGCAVLMKQSGFDAGLAVVVYLLWKERDRGGIRAAALLGAAALVPVAIAAGTAPDFANWWHAVVTYRTESESIWNGPLGKHVLLLAAGLRAAALALAVPIVLSIGGWRLAPTLVKLWFAAGLVGIAGGGNFWPHYWIQIVPPLCIIAALRLRELVDSGDLRRPVRVLPLALATAFCLVMTFAALAGNEQRRVRLVLPGEQLRLYDDDIAAYVRARTEPGERVLIVPPIGAPIQFLADRPPAYRYMWYRPAKSIPGAVPELRALVRDRTVRVVVVLADPAAVDPQGVTTALLRRNYEVVKSIGPTAVLVRREE
jgi:4-amino-4-deoxy-L-arabinose transferase-like glycosyltransferase